MKTETTNYVLYDVETSGTSAHYDQIFQLGALLTDEHLNVLDRLELRCRRLPHVISNPEAMLATGVDATIRNGGDHSHYALVRAAQQTFNAWSPAIFCAHNGFQFDERMLRQALFQTLHRPFLTQSHGNQRIDSMTMAQACAILAPGRLTIPDLNGKPTFRLGPLARANGVAFPEESAHDALHDVEAMRGLMAVMADRAPDVYAATLRNSNKKALLSLIRSHEILRFSAVHAGRVISRIVAPVVTAPSNSNALCVFDLAHDPDSIRRLTDAELVGAFSASPRILRTIKLGSAPILSPVGVFPGEPRVTISANTLAERAKTIREDRTFQARIARAMDRHFAKSPASAAPAEQIYGRFIDPADEVLCETFHETRWEDRRLVLDQIGDDRLRVFGLRLIYAERPDLLTDVERAEMHAWQCDRILADNDAAWMPAPTALQAVTEMIRRAQPSMARQLEQYVQRIARIRTVATQYPHAAKIRKAG
ncbi:hypothetical protein CCR94_07220 [Rhodoblastus sphagnicola]|uniref:Exodeoxyribonuclease I n=1 Tax=Rhodoblastus sphagnicola TaxID=333368 RepID=A0A2S6NBI6_9HYPH|nr:exonuclease domain-containing protein [Rhodoblastus sphagnicola]MBB4199645.1 exodeoxyribonuclease-1 [Rhodoblastus sphagnicola]PPQ31992.1 hypothetical protein CCR94_07220 [Rhodoblastus sphagnicola]